MIPQYLSPMVRIITHCGAGSSPEVKDIAEKAGKVGLEILKKGGKAIDAVEEAIVLLEDDERLNAGTGSRMRINGRIQMDAAIMDSNLNCGAVAAIMNVKNPIRVARKVMETPHIVIVGEDATNFARRMGFEYFDPTTKKSKESLEEAKKKIQRGDLPKWAKKWKEMEWKETVGAVAIDSKGEFASGSSTGGTSFMLPGRVGDTPLIGCGIYAGKEGAVSVTGVGEEIIKRVLSKSIYDWIASGRKVQEACHSAIALFDEEFPIGVIAISKKDWGVASNREMAWWSGGEN